MPIRTYDNHTVISDSLPALKVEVNSNLEYIGTKVFRLNDVVEVEVFVFVETQDNKVIRRLVVHFERFLDRVDPSFRMRVPTPLTHEIAGQLFYTDIRCMPSSVFHNYHEKTDEDWVHVYLMMEEKGYQPPNYKANVLIKRLGQIVAADGMAEFLLIYTEPLDDGVVDASPDNTYLITDRQRHLLADFEQRALNSFKIIVPEK